MKTNYSLSSGLATMIACLFFGMFSLQTVFSQCPTVANPSFSTCAFDGTSITTVADLETLADVTGTTDAVVWFDSLVGGTQYNDTDAITDSIYYLDTDTAACTPRIAVTVTVNGEQPICIDGDCDGDFFCESTMATVQDILDEFSGMNLEVSNAPGGAALPSTDLLVSAVYWVTQTEVGCTSNPLPYNVIIQQVTPPTIVDPFPFFCQPPVPTVADISGAVTGSVGFWYADASLSVVLPNTTPLIDGEDYFTYALFGTCRSESVSVTVTIGDTPEAGTFSPNPLQFCDDGDISDQALADYGIADITNVDLLTLLSGQDAGGVWTDDNATGELSSGSDTIINLANLYALFQAGTITQAGFTYTVTNTYNLPDGSTDTCEDTATLTVTFDPILVAGTATAPLVICETNIPANTPVDLFTLLTGEDPGGTWTDDTGSCVSLADPTAVDISCLTPGDYTYTYTVNQTTTCPPETETVTITITEAPDLVINSPENFCITDNTVGNIDLFTYLTTDSSGGTGTWTDVNGTGALTLPSTVNVATLQGLGDGSYTFNYEVDNGAGCMNDVNMIIVIDPENEAGTALAPAVICENNLVNNFDLFTLLTGNDTGGTWADDEATGALTGNIVDLTAIAQPYDPTGYDFTYTASNTSCPDDTETVTIIITEMPDLVINSPENFCITDNTSGNIDLFTYLTTDSSSGTGTWTDTNGTGALTLPSSVNVTTLQGLGDGSYTFNYSVDNGDGCTNDINMVFIIDPENEAGTPSNTLICETNLVNNFDLFTLLTGNDTGGTWTDDEATGALTGNILDLFAIAQPYDPTGYDFTYTASNASCPDDTATVTIILTDVPEAGNGSTQTICISPPDGSSIDLFTLLSGHDLGGTWTDLSGSGALTLPSNILVSTLQGLGAGTYTYEYGIDNGDGCTDTAQVSITIEPLPEPVNATVNICYTDLVAGTNPFVNLDSFVTAPGDPLTVDWSVVAPTPATTLTDTLVGTIDWSDILANSTIGTSTVFTFHATSNTAVDCVPDLGDVIVTVIDIPAPTYTGTNLYCPNAGDVTVQDIINDFAATFGGNIILYDVATGGTPLDPTTVLPPNTYTFYGAEQDTAGAGCESSPRTMITITVNPNSNAGVDGAINICTTDTATTDLFNLLSGSPDTGGSWTGPIATSNGDQGTIDPTLLADGLHTFTYTVTGIPPCPDDTAQVFVTIDPLPNGGGNGPVQNLCSNGTSIDLFALLTGTPDMGGTWSPALNSGTNILDPSIDTAGTYTYTVTNACGTATPAAEIVINITPTPDITNPGDQTACNSFDLTTLPITGNNLTGNQNYYSAPNGGGSILTTITAMGATTVYIYDATAPTICTDEESFTVTITATPDITPITPGPVCDSFTFPPFAGTDLNNPNYNSEADGSGDSYAVSDTFIPTTAGDYTFYMLDANGTCTEQEQFTVTINQTPDPGTDNTVTNCISDPTYTLIDQLGGTPDTGGNWYLSTDLTTALGDDTFTFNPATDFPNSNNGTSVTYIYIVSATAPCTDQQAQVTITLNNPGLPTAQDQGFCAIDGATVADLVVNGIGGYTWYDTDVSTTSLPGTELLIDGEDYWVTQDNGCESLRIQVNVTISDSGTPDLLTGGAEFCINDGPTLGLLEANIDNPNGYPIVWYDSETGGNIITSLGLLLTHEQTYYASYFVDPCESEIRLAITVDLTLCDDILIPDAFSPNNDGQNDTYTIPNIGLLYPNYTIEIYNRYGNVVYEGNINTADFDGKSNQGNFLSNDILPVGVYFYIIDFKDGTTKPKQGRLYLSR